jgi:hypothetical protein
MKIMWNVETKAGNSNALVISFTRNKKKIRNLNDVLQNTKAQILKEGQKDLSLKRSQEMQKIKRAESPKSKPAARTSKKEFPKGNNKIQVEKKWKFNFGKNNKLK